MTHRFVEQRPARVMRRGADFRLPLGLKNVQGKTKYATSQAENTFRQSANAAQASLTEIVPS